MKKTIFALALTLTTASAFAGTTASLVLKGVIAPILDISLTSESLATNLPLDQQVSNQKVGTLTEKSNSGSGYKVTALSTNRGKLVRGNDSANGIDYQLTYNGNSVTLSSSTASTVGTYSSRGSSDRELKISYSKPADYLPAGEYTDTVTFTIAAN